MKPRPQLYAYLGVDKNGKLALYCSTCRLNPIGNRLEKGKPLPESVYEFVDPTTPLRHETPCLVSLLDLQEYFDKEAAGKK